MSSRSNLSRPTIPYLQMDNVVVAPHVAGKELGVISAPRRFRVFKHATSLARRRARERRHRDLKLNFQSPQRAEEIRNG